jgi:hypothetical protein
MIAQGHSNTTEYGGATRWRCSRSSHVLPLEMWRLARTATSSQGTSDLRRVGGALSGSQYRWTIGAQSHSHVVVSWVDALRSDLHAAREWRGEWQTILYELERMLKPWSKGTGLVWSIYCWNIDRTIRIHWYCKKCYLELQMEQRRDVAVETSKSSHAHILWQRGAINLVRVIEHVLMFGV